ncbi:MAG: S-adenosylmethionine:tRNA ribosyltransferase-isomerase, partial [Ktedonobacteraceae bacterium]
TNIVLHTGLSSYMDDRLDAEHPISEEEYTIGSSAARKINRARSKRNRIIAIGTTVVRALESGAARDGTVFPCHGYTRLHITREYNLKLVDGLLTGLHEPQASHLDLLQAFLPEKSLYRAYQEAVKLGYLWHEFGDLNLIV